MYADLGMGVGSKFRRLSGSEFRWHLGVDPDMISGGDLGMEICEGGFHPPMGFTRP